MNPIIFSLSLFIFLSIFSFCELRAAKFSGLKVHGDHGVLEPIVSEVPKNRSGVTRKDILKRVRLKLL